MNKAFLLILLFVFGTITCNSTFAQDTTLYNLTFKTTNQPMWKTPGFSIDFDYKLFDEGWNGGGGFDFTESICGQDFGLGFSAYSKGNIDMNFYIKDVTTGTIDEVTYPVEIGFITPDPTTVSAGQTMVISSFFSVTGEPSIETSYPEAGRAGLRFGFEMDNSIDLKACFFDCANGGFDVGFDIDTALFQIGLREGQTFYPGMVPLSEIDPGFEMPTLPCIDIPGSIPGIVESDFLPIHIGGSSENCDCCNHPDACMPDTCGCLASCPDIDCDNDGKPDNGSFSLSDYMEADLDIPYIDEISTNIIDASTIQGTGVDTFITAGFDPIGAMLQYSPYKLSGDLQMPPPVDCFMGFNYTIFSASVNFDIMNKQTFDFKADAYAVLTLPVEVDYLIRNQQRAVILTGKDSIIEFKIGHDLEFKFPCDYEFIDFKPEIYLKNKFRNRTYNDYALSMGMEALAFELSFEKVVIIPAFEEEICIWPAPCFTLETPEVAFDIDDIGLGPLWEDEFQLGHFEHDIFNKEWELAGFRRLQDDPFRISPQKLAITFDPTQVACYNKPIGNITLNSTGGTSPFTYEWSNGSTQRNLQNVQAGDYYVKVTDANECVAFNGLNISEPNELIITPKITNCLCNGDNTGQIKLIVEGGVAPYSYTWSNGGNESTNSLLSSGEYIYTVTDANNCLVTDTLFVLEPTELVSYVNNFGKPLCNGSNEGYIKINTTGGTKPYRYQWSNFAVTQNIDSLTANNYTVTVSDINGCNLTISQAIEEPELFQAELIAKPISCYKGNDGNVTLNLSGGTQPYKIKWFSNEYTLNNKTNFIDRLTTGMYVVEAYDSNYCFIKDSILVAEPENPFYSEVEVIKPTCNGASDGSIIARPINGTPPYAYTWSEGQTTETADGLVAGKYDLTISDTYNCLTYNNAVVLEPDAFNESIEITPVSCPFESDGKINIITNGATQPFEILWSNNETEFNISKLSEGNYSATITDANECEYFVDVNLPVNGIDCFDIPSAFTPNGDGQNDTWKIKGMEHYSNHKVIVFTKWGEEIYSSAGTYEEWNGTRNGKDCPAATYYYVIDMGTGEPLIKGLVTIVR